ncbi:MAG: CoA transferase [Cohaesibacter sp.]|nr:CoA transferase [Cohaesibacter sp.]
MEIYRALVVNGLTSLLCDWLGHLQGASALLTLSLERAMSETRPLSGIRVIDFGQYVAGPAAAMMLADLGAEVVHIDPPTGKRWDIPAADMLNRGKICVRLDLKIEAGCQEAKRLIASADVLIENFRPGVMERLGLGSEAMTALNPALVYLSMPGFASSDPAYSAKPAWEAVIAAACGQYSDMGLNRVLMGIEPSFSPLTLASGYGAVLGASAVTLALAKRAEHGYGDVIEVPLAAALMEGLAYNSQQVENYPERYKSNREKEIDRRRASGQTMDARYSDLQELLDPFYRNYVCKDGRQIYVVSASHKYHPERVLKILGLWEQLVAEGLPNHDPYLDVADWPDDCTLASYPLSQVWADRVSGLMKEAFLEKTAYEWEQIFGQAAAPAAAQRQTAEWLRSDHANQSGLILKVSDPEHGMMRQLGALAWLHSDADAVLTPLERSDAKSTDISDRVLSKCQGQRPEGGWLDGLKILDLTNVIAGPTIASTLSRFGADVLSIDPVEPTMDPWNSIIFGMHAGRGKRSMLMDLKSSEGQDLLADLIDWADVITANATDKQLESLGLSPDRLASLKPELILCQLDCYGGPARGPRSDYLGYDDLAQASTGIMARFGGSLDTPEEHAHFGTIDVLGGFCGALAVGAALVQRARTGKGDIARASLCAAGQLIQAPFMYDCANRAPFDEPKGRQAVGYGPLYRTYLASDGYFFLAVPAGRLDDLGRALKLDHLSDLTQTDLSMELESLFASGTIAHWCSLLEPADLAIQALNKMHQVRDDHLKAESEGDIDLDRATFSFIRHDDHPSGRLVDLVAPNAIRPRFASVTIPGPMPPPGAHSRELLKEFGRDDETIQTMMTKTILAERWCEKYLPE